MYRDNIRGEFTLIKYLTKFPSAISELKAVPFLKKANLFQASHLQEKYFFDFINGALLYSISI